MTLPSNADGLIDDEGNLLGVVNVVDALVVLFVLAILLAGAVLVLTSGEDTGSDRATTYATLDLGTQPDYIVSAINEGDTYSPGKQANLTVTDVYLAPQGGQTRVLVRTELRGLDDDESVEYMNAPPRLGRTLDISTNAYNVSGRISDVGSGSALDTNTTTVVLRDTLSPTDASEVTPGDEVTVAGRTVATVEDVVVYPTGNPNRQIVLVETRLETYAQQGTTRFGDTQVRPGQGVGIVTPDYTINGRIERVGRGLKQDSLTNRTVTLEMTRVQPEIATVLRPGLTEQVGEIRTASVTAVDKEPSPVFATADNGSLVESDHPRLQDVRLTTELRVRETAGGIEFRGDRLQYGSNVVLDLGAVTVRATVVEIA